MDNKNAGHVAYLHSTTIISPDSKVDCIRILCNSRKIVDSKLNISIVAQSLAAKLEIYNQLPKETSAVTLLYN